uniref:ABC transporter domain-containing protein n=1 Tax=Loxodonta africana TaxID=9785 RepID=G3TCM3_LOXAF
KKRRQVDLLQWRCLLCKIPQVLFLAEFLWPCILFTILTVLRFQEPPRHRESCYLQARDLPSRGVFPFVQGLLCNTGSQCRNISYERSDEYRFRSSRFQTAADNMKKVNHLAFLREMQEFLEEVYETMEKAKNLQKLWVKRPKVPDSSYGSSFLTMDLNKTEDMILKLESLHQQPPIWDFLLSLPRLYAKNVHAEDSIWAAAQFLQAVLNSLTSLEDLDWLPFNHTLSKVFESILNVTISTLTFLQEHGVAVTESGYNLSLKDMVWNPQLVQSDLKSRFGFDELHSERILNYSAELKEIPTDRLLEWMVCSALFSTSEDETGGEGHPGDCDSKWSEAKDYLVHAVSWLQVYKQVLDQGQKGDLLEKMLTGTGQCLETLRDQFEVESKPWKVAEALHSLLLLLNDSLAADGTKGSHKSPKIFPHLLRLQSLLQMLPRWPTLQWLLQLDSALRKAITQNLRFVQEVLIHLEMPANSSKLDKSDQLKLEMDMVFWKLKQILKNNATNMCLNGHLSEQEALLRPQNARVWESLVGLLCQQNSSNVTNILNKLISSVEDADRILQEVIIGHTDMPVSMTEDFLGWPEVQAQFSGVSLSCTRVFQPLGADALPGSEVYSADCKDQLISTVLFCTLEKIQLSLEQTDYWKAFIGFIRKTCEVARNVNMQESFHSSRFGAFSEESPCYEENMDWKIISDNYFLFLNNLLKSPIASISRILNSTKDLLIMEDKLHTLKDGQMNSLLAFVEFLEKLLLPNPFNSSSIPKFHNLSSLTETLLNISLLWINHLKSLERDPPAVDAQKLLKFGKEVIEKIQALESHWIRMESGNMSRYLELILFQLNPKLWELWMYGVSEGERAKLENLSTLLNFSAPDDGRVCSKSFNSSQLVHSEGPKTLAANMDFVDLSETIISSLYEFGFVRQEQVSEALDTVYAIRNASDLFSTLSESQKEEVDKMLTLMYRNVFKDKDSAFLLQISFSLYQRIYKFFLSDQNRELLLTFLTQITKHILDIIKQFNFQSISKAFSLLSETTSVLGRISELPYCQQLLSFFHFLKLQAQSLRSIEGQDLEMIHAILTGLEQLFIVDGDFRISLFQYMSQLFNGSVEALLGNECFALDNKSVSSLNYSTDGRSSFILPWAQILSNLSANGRTFNELMATHCTISWLQMWTEIWGSVSQVFQFDTNVFTSLHVVLNQLLDELESDVKFSKSCQGVFFTNRPTRLLLNLFKTVTHSVGFHDWNDSLDVSGLWVALDDAFVIVKSLHPDKVEKSLSTMETSLYQLKIFPLNTNISREFLYSLLEVFIELSKGSEYTGRGIHLPRHFLLNNLTDYEAKFQGVITELRETILFLRNVSHDRDLLSCAEVLHNVTKLIFEDDFLYVNTSQRAFHIIAMLNSTFSSENVTRRLEGCIALVDVMNHLYAKYNSSISQGQLRGFWGSFKDMENKISTAMKLVSWLLNMKEPLCSLNKSNINCVNIYLKNVTDFLNVILIEVFEKEKVPKFEIFLTLLNDSTNPVRMVINNLTRDFDLPSQPNWKCFAESLLRPTKMSNEIPNQFQNIWLHLILLGKEIQKILKDISPNIPENTFSYKSEKFLSMFATSPKERDLNSLGNSIYHFASYLAFNLLHNLQNSSKTIPHEIMETVVLGIQLVRDVFNSLMPTIHHDIQENTSNIQVLKKVSSLMQSLKKTDIDLLVDQLEQLRESLMGFFKNISRLDTGNLGINLLVGLMEKFVESSHSWNINHLLKLSRLFPQDDVNVVVDMYYVLPHAVRLLQRLADKNITEAIKDVFNFTLFHGITISSISKEDFAIAVKTLLDITELVSDKPAIVAEALACLPEIRCWNHTTSEFQQNPKLEACKLIFSPFYRKVAGILDHLHLSLPDENLQCSNKSSRMKLTRKVVCVIHELVDWNSILLEMSEVFHIKTPLVKAIQKFWNKVLLYVLFSGNQSIGSISELCTGGSIKQIALQIIKVFKNVNFTKVTSGEKSFDRAGSLNKTININEGTEVSLPNNNSLNLEIIEKLISGGLIPENSSNSLVSPFKLFLNVNLTGGSLEALSNLTKKNEAPYNFEELWLEFEQTAKDVKRNISHLISEINKEIKMINSVALQNTTLQFSHILESLNSSSLKTLEIIEDFLMSRRNWLHKYANKNYIRMIQTLFPVTANESSTDDVVSLAKDITTFLDYLKNISKESNFDFVLLTHLLNQQQLTNFSIIQLLLESIIINSINNLVGNSQEAALNLSDTGLQIVDFINFTLNHIQSENGGQIIFPPQSIPKENFENKISLLLKDFHKDVIAEMRFVKRMWLFELLVGSPSYLGQEDKPMSIFSSLKETIYHPIKSSFILDNGEFYFVMQDLLNALLSETSTKSKTEDNLELLTMVNQLLFSMNCSEYLLKLDQNLRSALQLVRKTSVEIASIMDTYFKAFLLYPILQEVILPNLTDLFSFIKNLFHLETEQHEVTKRLRGGVSRAGGESHVEPLLELSRPLSMLVQDSAELGHLATSVDSTVKLLKLGKVSEKVTNIFETHFISNTNYTLKFFDTLYSTLQQTIQSTVTEIATLKKDHLIYGKIKDLKPFLDLAFEVITAEPNISQDSHLFNISSTIRSSVNQSKDFSDILEEIVKFLTSMKIHLGDLDHLVVMFNNGTQIFSIDSLNLWEEILDCLVAVKDVTNQMDILHPNPISSRSCPQDTKWKRIHEVILSFGCNVTKQNRTKIGTYLKMVTELTLALWDNLKKDDIFSLLLTFAWHLNNLLEIIGTVAEKGGINSDYVGKVFFFLFLFFNTSLIQNITQQQLEKTIEIEFSRVALLHLNTSQWMNSIKTLLLRVLELFIDTTTGKNALSEKEERAKTAMIDSPYIFNPLPCFKKYMNRIFVLTEFWQKEVPLTDRSVLEMCQVFQQPTQPSRAILTLQKVKMLAVHIFIIFAENPSLIKDVLCATLSCKQGGIRPLILPVMQGLALLHDHYQEIKQIWSSPMQLNCESLNRNLSRSLESFKSNLENAAETDCQCQPALETVQWHTHMLAKNLEETLSSGNSIMTFLSNFRVTDGVKVKDLMKNVTKLTEELQSSIQLSDETISFILETNISLSKVLSSALTAALSGRCDQDILRPLLTFHEDEASVFAMKELCALPGSEAYSLIVLMSRNLNLRSFIYKTLIPSEAKSLLISLLDVVSSISSLLAKAQRVLEYLPEFLQAFKITALLDMPALQQVSQKGQPRSSPFGSFQSVMKMVCKEQASFLSNSNTFIDLPRVNDLLEGDKEKFNIPEDSTPFCLKLYQEILQFPNGALVWAFLKPILHGKILYTPNTPEINKVIQKANYTFYFVDKIKTLSKTLLNMSSLFQRSGNGQMLNQFQEALRNKFIRNFVENQLHIDVDTLTEKLRTYGGMLDKMFNHAEAGHLQFLGHILVNLSSCVELNRFQAHESVDLLETKAHELMQRNDFLASIIFNNSFVNKNFQSESLKLPPHVTYTIRTSILYSTRTDLVKNPFWKFHPQSLPADGFKYNYIFVPLQDMIERAIISVQTGQDAPEPAAQVQAIPYPCHTSDLFLNNVGFFFPLIMMLTWMVSVASMVRKLVYEREIQIEEYLRMMGVHPTTHFLAWFLENTAMLTLSSAALAIILKTSSIFTYSNALIIFLFLLDFGVSVVMLSYFLSAFFSQANTAALCTSLVYMISFLPYIVLLVLHNQLSFVIQTLLCFLSTTAFGQGVFFITFLEAQEPGIQWNNMYQSPEQGNMTFGWICWMILFDSSLYFLCGWYFSNLIPGTFGLRQPWYFPFTASYWKTVFGLVEKKCYKSSDLFFNENFGSKGSSPQHREENLEGGSSGVTLVSVTKEYEPNKVAIKDLTVTFHKDQITALLGTNGAGKTTVISMLTGLYPPTSGSIIINGKNLQTDLATIRMELGVCLQHDVLFNNLTVLEHLLLFASIKAPQWTKKELCQQVNKTLQAVGLSEHQHKPTQALSGGMKRKLSIGIAFIGVSRTVVLDEPTSGVDPCSRRNIWDILLRYREDAGRTIIFTTHHLDEAEVLSDQVAILQHGQLRCCHPAFCLKEAYGQGLSLTLTRQPSVLEIHDLKDIARVTSLIQIYIPQAALKASSGNELAYALPNDADKASFKGLFQALDQNLHHLHLTGYGISDTTLEEVMGLL